VKQLRIKEGQGDILPSVVSPDIIEQQVIPETNFVTREQFDVGLDTIVGKIANRFESKNAFTPEVQGVIKAVDQVKDLTTALKDPVSIGIESGISNLVDSVMNNAFTNMQGGQQAPQEPPLKNTLAKIAINNLTGESSPLPQLLDALTNILGKDKVRDGYDAGMGYIEKQQNQNNLPNTVLQLDETKQEDVVVYAQLQGYSDIQYAQEMLIEHKRRLYGEIEEYQKIQQGGQQAAVVEPVAKEQYVEQPVVEQPVVEQPVVEQPVVEQLVAEEEPVMKANKVVVLHSKPRKLKVAEDKVKQDIDNNDDNELVDIDSIMDELGE